MTALPRCSALGIDFFMRLRLMNQRHSLSIILRETTVRQALPHCEAAKPLKMADD
jgi:hypothetical protein